MRRRDELAALAERHTLPAEVVEDLEDLLDEAEDAERYDDLGPIASGGMGEVRRVRDRALGRVVALKRLHPWIAERPGALARFFAEAEVAAQLQHPAIVPVHDAGRLADGTAFLTMQEVRGRTLTEAITDARGAGDAGPALRGLVDAFAIVCDAVAYAHSRGVLHRDLKPDNVMIGEHGAVYVVDWGLSRAAVPASDEGAVVSATRGATRAGSLVGTPVYASPEQARGEAADARTDVYGLGAILYEVLAGRPPHEGVDLQEILAAVAAGPPPPPGPPELVRLCLRCLSAKREDRPPDGAAVASEVRSWSQGTRLREAALAVVREAEPLRRRSADLLARAATLEADAEEVLRVLRPLDPEPLKAPGWAMQEEAARLRREAAVEAARRESLLVAALTRVPDLEEAHELLAETFLHAHAAAEAARDDDAAASAEVRLREHARALPATSGTRRRCVAWLGGEGAVTLVTEPAGADVELLRCVTRHRRLVPDPAGGLGVTPLRAVALPHGSWVLRVRHPARATIDYPVSIGRGEHWDGIPPGASEAAPVRLPFRDELGEDDAYVAAGWFVCGSRRKLFDSVPARPVWCDAFVIRRFPVTNREYLAFLDDLVAAGREEDAMASVPRERAGAGEPGAPLYARAASGMFELATDADGDRWDLEWPVMHVDWTSARAYAAWWARRTARAWRLPAELEREKAARGVDGRHYPWGDAPPDPTWCCLRESHPGRPLPSVVGAFPTDVSVYGVRGVAGNVQDWCADAWRREGPATPGDRVVPVPADEDADRRPYRGGIFYGSDGWAACATRDSGPPSYRGSNAGFRLARSAP